jgi:hypothetical protein
MQWTTLGAPNTFRTCVKLGSAIWAAGFALVTHAQAPGSITFAAPGSNTPEAVPALGTPMTTVLAILLGITAVVAFRRHSRALSIVVAVVSSGLLWASLGAPNSGVAQTNPAVFSITNPTGGTFAVNPFVTNEYTNDSGATLEVESATLPEPAFCTPGFGQGSCLVGTMLAPGDMCSVFCGGGNASDRRLKADIELLGETHNGLPWYRFRYIGSSEIYEGVMAQDVQQVYPDAVVTDSRGYMAVDYQMLGLEMRRVN